MNRRQFVKLSSVAVAGMPLANLSTLQAAVADEKQTTPDLYQAFRNPTGTMRPFVRWWWNGNRVRKDELLRELDLLKAVGIRGVEINPIEFPETADPMDSRPMDWLSDPWLEMLQAAVQGAKERGLTCDIIVGSGWPFGGEFLEIPEQTQMVTIGTRSVKGPARIEVRKEELLNEVEPPIMSKRQNKLKELIGLRLSPAALQEFKPGLDFGGQLQKELITVEVPEGEHVLYSVVKLTGYQSVIHGAPGASGPVLNHYNKAAVQKYLDRMSDAIERKLGPLGRNFRSLFVDSMELEGANWCDDMAEEFSRRRGYRLEPYLPFMLFKTGRMGRPLKEVYGARLEGAAQDVINRVRYDFETVKVELFRERFLETFLAWCSKHGVQSRVQAYGREHHPLDSSLLLDIPDCETWVRPHAGEPLKEKDYSYGRTYTQVNKFVSSAAHLSGKRLVSCEELTNTQVVFNADLERLKITSDQSILSGVTHPVFHGFNYSPKEAPFPGWVRYGTFFNERNTWWPYFPAFVDYRSRLSAVFQNTDMYADIALLNPLADQWAKFGIAWDPNPERAHPHYVFNVWEAIHQSGCGCDYVSERVLQGASADDGLLTYGNRTYKILILVEVESMQPATAQAIRAFVEAGGKVVFIGSDPSRAPGLKDHEKPDREVSEVIGEMKRRHPERVISHPAPQPLETMLQWFSKLKERAGIESYAAFAKPVSSVSQVRYTAKGRDLFFVCNSSGTETFQVDVSFKTQYPTAWVWEAETGERWLCEPEGKEKRLRISLAPSESRLIVFDAEKADGRKFVEFKEGAKTVSGPWQVRLEHVNGTSRSVALEQLVDFKDVQDLKSFAGVIWYEKTIQVDDPGASKSLSLGKVHGVSEVFLNGRKLGVKWHGAHSYDVTGALKAGPNELRVKVTTTLGNYMKSLKDNKDALKWLKAQPLYPAGMVGPVKI